MVIDGLNTEDKSNQESFIQISLQACDWLTRLPEWRQSSHRLGHLTTPVKEHSSTSRINYFRA